MAAVEAEAEEELAQVHSRAQVEVAEAQAEARAVVGRRQTWEEHKQLALHAAQRQAASTDTRLQAMVVAAAMAASSEQRCSRAQQ